MAELDIHLLITSKIKVNVTANLEINLFIDPKTVQNNGQQTITSKLNGKETSGTMQITYKDGVKNQYTNVNGSIETFDKKKRITRSLY